jgi:hypothetical protein
MTTYVWADGVIQEEQTDTVALNDGSGADWLILQGTAVPIWRLLAEPRSAEAIAAELGSAYEGDASEIRRDVETVVAQLLEKNLIREAP